MHFPFYDCLPLPILPRRQAPCRRAFVVTLLTQVVLTILDHNRVQLFSWKTGWILLSALANLSVTHGLRFRTFFQNRRKGVWTNVGQVHFYCKAMC